MNNIALVHVEDRSTHMLFSMFNISIFVFVLYFHCICVKLFFSVEQGCYFILVTDICLPNEQTVARNKETSEKNSFETTCAFSQIHQDLMEKESCLIIPQRYLEENPIYKEKLVLMAEIYTAMVEMYTAL